MSVTRETKKGIPTGKWVIHCRYTDWQGQNKQKFKRGFKTKREAVEWEKDFLLSSKNNVNMKFGDFVSRYFSEIKPKLKYNTYLSKLDIARLHILPYFENVALSEITPNSIIKWQNTVIEKGLENGKGYSQTYLRTINSQMSALFNYEVRFYGLTQNPVQIAGSMGRKKTSAEMQFWTSAEFKKFISVVDDNLAFCAFETLFYTGCRIGELLALTPSDFDFEVNTMSITKSYQHLQGQDVITSPKTESSIRKIYIPDFLAEDVQDFISSLYKIGNNDRIFQTCKSTLSVKLKKYAAIAGIKPIRIHDLRHSAATYYLSELEANPIVVSKLLGHEKISLTLDTYTHNNTENQKNLAELTNKAFQANAEENKNEC